jgi:hypothetical protein
MVIINNHGCPDSRHTLAEPYSVTLVYVKLAFPACLPACCSGLLDHSRSGVLHACWCCGGIHACRGFMHLINSDKYRDTHPHSKELQGKAAALSTRTAQ